MATFNAGSIDARLTLDRSAFTKELRNARAQATRFENKDIKPKLNIDNQDQLAALAAQVEALSREKIEIPVDVESVVDELAVVEAEVEAIAGKHHQLTMDFDFDQAEALGQLALFDAEVAAILDNHPTVQVDVDAGEAMTELAVVGAAVEALDGKDIDIKVDVDKKGLSGTAATVSRMEAIIAGILLLAPLIPAAVVPATTAIGGLASALTAAAGGVAVLGLGVGLQVKDMISAQKEVTKAQEKLDGLKEGTKEYKAAAEDLHNKQKAFNDTFGVAADAFTGFKDAVNSFKADTQKEALGLIAQGLDLMAQIMPKLTPIFNVFAPIMGSFLDKISAFIGSGEGDRMFAFFQNIGGQSFEQLGRAIGNILLLFGRLFEAFGPTGVALVKAIADSIGGLADQADGLADKKGFQEFLAYSAEYGPRVMELLDALWDAMIALGKALAPLAGPALTAFTGLFRAIADAPTGVLTTLIVLFGGLFLAVQATAAIMSAVSAVMGLFGTIASVFSGIITVVTTAWELLSLAFAASPIGVIVVAIALLVAGLVLAYKHIGWFRDIVDSVVHAVVGFFKWLYDVLFGHSIIPDMVAAFKFYGEMWLNIAKFVFNAIKTVVKVVWDAISALIHAAFAVIKGIFGTQFAIIKAVVTAALRIVKDIFTGNFKDIPAALRDMVSTLLGIFRGLGQRILGALGNMGKLLYNAGKAVIQGLIDGVGAMFKALGDKMSAVGGFIKDHLPGSPAKRGPLSGYGGYHMRHAGAEIIRQLSAGIDQQVNLDATLGRVTNKIAATNAGISAALGTDGKMGASGTGGNMTVVVNNPGRMRVTDSYDHALKQVAFANGYTP